jgi:hypothetical protein
MATYGYVLTTTWNIIVMTCDKCGQSLEVGDWPFCPHGQGTSAVIGDDIPGGVVIRHMSSIPQTFYSKSAIKKAAFERGLTHGDDTPKINPRLKDQEAQRAFDKAEAQRRG